MRLLLSLVLLATLAGPLGAAELVFPPGSRIGLVPPDDMQPARGLAGFRNPRTGAAILAVEMPPDAFPGLAAGFSDEALKAQGFALNQRETVQIAGGQAILVAGQQIEGDRMIPKVVLLTADPTMTVLMIGQLAPGASPAEIAVIETALKTVSVRPPLAMDEQLASLPFRIGEFAGFRTIRVMAGNSILLTDGPEDVIREADQPVLIVAQSFAPAPSGPSRDVFARQALAANAFVKDVVIERSQAFRQGGTEWHEIVAKAIDSTSGAPVIVMQTIRFEPDSYIRSVGVVRTDQRDAILPRFRRIVDSAAEK